MRQSATHPVAIPALATLLGLFAQASQAAPPTIKGTSPFGVVRGEATELSVKGSNLAGNPRLVAPFPFTIEGPSEGSDDSQFKIKIKPDALTPIGTYPVRVQTDDGLSAPVLLAVGRLPQVAEKEDNTTFETAQPIQVPAVVEGESAGNDVDFFKFSGKKGERIVIDAQCARIGSGVDPSIRLTTASREFVAAADDTPGLLTDARIIAVLPQDGEYVIEISDSRYQGGGRPVYRLLVGAVPLAEEVYPLGGRRGETVGLELRGGTLTGVKTAVLTMSPATGSTLDRADSEIEGVSSLSVNDLPEAREPSVETAGPIRVAAPAVINGRIDPQGDEDQFVLAVTAGRKYRIKVDAAERGSALDGVLTVIGPKGVSLATADDTTTAADAATKKPAMVSADPTLEYKVPDGQSEITIGLKDLQGRGGIGFPYRIVATPVAPNFQVSLIDPQVSIPRGGTAAVGVTVVRKDFAGPITLRVDSPPAGITARPGLIANGQLVGALSVDATSDVAPGPYVLDIIGEGAGPDGPIVSKGTKTIIFAEQSGMPTNSIEQVGLAAAPALELPAKLDIPAEPVEVVHGYGAPVVVKAVRKEGAEGVLAFGSLPLPPGLAVPEVKTDDKASEATVNVNTTADVPLGRMTLALTAKGKLAGADRSLAAPLVTIEVIRPAAVELVSPSVEIKPGATVEVKGKVVRKGPFKEPVTVKLNGLPAGVKAEPVTVAADATEFTVALQAEEKAAEASAGATVALAFQINKKDYPAPTAPLAVKVIAQ